MEQTADEIVKLGREALPVTADVQKKTQIDAAVEKIIAQFKKIDILVNNAGTNILKPIVPGIKYDGWQVADGWDKQMEEDDWHLVLNTNLTSIFLFSQAVAPHMIKQKHGKIINISSNSSNIAPPYWSAYCVSKSGVNMLTRCLATELASYKINVNAIGPGDILTELSQHVLNDPDAGKTMLSYIPMARWGKTREVAILAVYLASEASDFMTGETLIIDGGQLARGAGV